MKKELLRALLATLALLAGPRHCEAQGTAFTYQGRLTDNGTAASGNYDLVFTLYNATSAGAVVGLPGTNSNVAVANGLFSTTLDFGSAAFDGNPRWVEIAVRHAGAGTFTPLNPRQPITPTPYAIYSTAAGTSASVSGSVPAGQISGTISSGNIAAGSISTAKLADGAVTSVKISPGAVTQLGTPNGNIDNAFQVANGGDAALQGDLTVDGGKGIVYNRSSAQKMLFVVVAGLSVNNLQVNSSVDGTLTWGNVGFTSAPAVFVGDFGGNGSGLQNYAQMLVTAHSVTPTGCSVRVLNAGNASGTFSGDFNCLIIGNR